MKFDVSPESINKVTNNLIQHANQFVKTSEIFGTVCETKIGFRASPSVTRETQKKKRQHGYTVKKQNNIIFAYGFEGQGVLYAAHAANQVLDLVLKSKVFTSQT